MVNKNKLYLKLPKKYEFSTKCYEFSIESIKDSNYSSVTLEDFKDVDINDIIDMPIFYNIGDTDIHDIYDIKKVHTECMHDQTAHANKKYNEFKLSIVTFKKRNDIFPASREYCSFTMVLTNSGYLKLMIKGSCDSQVNIDISSLSSDEIKEIVFNLLMTIQHYDSFDSNTEILDIDYVMARIIDIKTRYAYNKVYQFVCEILCRRGAQVYKNFTKLKFINDDKFYICAYDFYTNAAYLRKNNSMEISVKIDIVNKSITIYHECDSVDSDHFVIPVIPADFVEIITNNTPSNTYVDNTVNVSECIITVKLIGMRNDNFMQILYKFINTCQYDIGAESSVKSIRIDSSEGIIEVVTDITSHTHLFDIPLLVYNDISISRRLNEKDICTK